MTTLASGALFETAEPAARSDALVFFGATGDLAYKKIFPALVAMVRRRQLDIPIIGVAIEKWTIEQLRNRARESILAADPDAREADISKLAAMLRYVSGDYQKQATFKKLRTVLGKAVRPIHYLAIPPSFFDDVIEGLDKSGCAQNARLIVEKPFGRDVQSARTLNDVLHRVFRERDVFRIDHYLGKEAVQNLVYFRFGNSFLEPIWNRYHVKSVQITMAERFGIGSRGKLYEETGAIRDVIQNHLLQVVGFLAMEPPATGFSDSMRDEQVKVFRMIRPLTEENLVRGQYEGYRNEPDVAANSSVETFAAVKLFIESWRWAGVPFLIRAGKCLRHTVTEVQVELHRPPLVKFFPNKGNYVRFRLSPQVSIGIGARVKQAGDGWHGRDVVLSAVTPQNQDEMTPYERLLGDAMDGEGLLFTREDAVEAAWQIVQPVLTQKGQHDKQPLTYDKNSWGPSEAGQLVENYGGWHDPE